MAKISALDRIPQGEASGEELVPVIKYGRTMAAPVADIVAPAAQPFVDAAALAAANAESAVGPTYASIAAGLAATPPGRSFAVGNADGTVTVYLNDNGAALGQRTLATSDALASPAAGRGIDLLARVPYPVPTREALKALDVARYRTAILTEGERDGTFHYRFGNYAAEVAADTAEAVYIAVNGISPAVGVWKRSYSNLFVEFFGAIGDGATDDAVPLLAAGRFAERTGETIYLRGGRNYRTTKSLNFTKANPNDTRPVRIEGDAKIASLITGDLDEPYPVIDMTNNKRGGMANLVVRTTRTSLDTCSLLLAEKVHTGSQFITLRNVQIYNQSPNAKAAAVNVCGDQIFIAECEFTANGESAAAGYRIDGTNALGITSKYLGAPLKTTADMTIFSAIHTNFLCAGGPGLDVVGFTTCNVLGGYFATVNFASGATATANSICRLQSAGRVVRPSFLGCRSENQSSKVGVHIFEVVDDLRNGQFYGTFKTDAAGFLFTGANGKLFECEVKVGLTGGVFAKFGPLIRSTISVHDGDNNLGTFSPAGIAGSKNVTLSGRVGSLVSVLDTLATVPGLVVNGTGGEDASPAASRFEVISTRVGFPRGDTPTNFRPASRGLGKQLTISSYTPGALAQVASIPLPSSVLAYVGTGEAVQVYPTVEIEFDGQTAATWALSGQIALVATQGGVSTTLGTLGTLVVGADGIAAGVNGIKAKVQIYYTSSSGGLNAMVEIETVPAAGGRPFSLRRRSPLSGIARNITDDIVFSLQINNTGAAPLQYLYGSIEG